MGLDNPLHIAFLLLLLLLVFGAKRLPEMGRSLGEGLRGFKSTLNGESATSPPSVPQVAAPSIAASPVTAPVIAGPSFTAPAISGHPFAAPPIAAPPATAPLITAASIAASPIAATSIAAPPVAARGGDSRDARTHTGGSHAS